MSRFEEPLNEEEIDEEVRRFSIFLEVYLLIASIDENTPRFEQSLREIGDAIQEYDRQRSGKPIDEI